MIYSLLHGDFGAAIHYNFLALIAIGLLLWSYVAWIRSRRLGRPVPDWRRFRWSSMTVLVAVVGWFIIRNIPFAPFTSLNVV